MADATMPPGKYNRNNSLPSKHQMTHTPPRYKIRVDEDSAEKTSEFDIKHEDYCKSISIRGYGNQSYKVRDALDYSDIDDTSSRVGIYEPLLPALRRKFS